mmetsp:Transcript_6073/g.7526  ORF Transcript_6073/g.7526 Transcript_6073/m.7526 type:complete len:206 (-) Transcript_6073:167-784(-)
MGKTPSKQENLIEYPGTVSIEIRKGTHLRDTFIFARISEDVIVYDALLGYKLEHLYIQTKPNNNRHVLYHDKDRDCWFTTPIKNVSLKPKVKSSKIIIGECGMNILHTKPVLYLDTNCNKSGIILINPNNIITDNSVTTMKDIISLYTWKNYQFFASDMIDEMYIVRQVNDNNIDVNKRHVLSSLVDKFDIKKRMIPMMNTCLLK